MKNSTGLAGIALILGLCASLMGADPTFTVTPKQGNKVLVNGQMENAIVEQAPPDSVQSSGSIPTLITKIFKPPANPQKQFVAMPYWDGLKNATTHVDVLNNADGYKPWRMRDTPTEVQIAQMFSATTAAEFPLQVEGMLQPAVASVGNKTSTPQPPGRPGGTSLPVSKDAEIWAVKVPKDFKGIVLQDVTEYVASGGKISARAFAMSQLTSQEDVKITITIEDDIGGFGNAGILADRKTLEGGPGEYLVALFDEVIPAAHANAKKYKLTASASGYESATAYITIFNARWAENPDHKFEGYDPKPAPNDTAKRPQLVIGKGKTSIASQLSIPGGLPVMAITITGASNINPANSTGADTVATIVAANAAGSATVQAKKDAEVAEMNVTIWDEMEGKKVKFIYVKDTPPAAAPGDPPKPQDTGELTNTQRTAHFEVAKKLWLDQVLYNLSEHNNSGAFLTLTKYYEGASIPYKDAWKAVEDAQKTDKPGNNEIFVYVFWQIDWAWAGESQLGGKSVILDKSKIIEGRPAGQTLAHEIGHILGFKGDYPAIMEYTEDLMAYGDTQMRIHKYQADYIRDRQKK